MWIFPDSGTAVVINAEGAQRVSEAFPHYWQRGLVAPSPGDRGIVMGEERAGHVDVAFAHGYTLPVRPEEIDPVPDWNGADEAPERSFEDTLLTPEPSEEKIRVGTTDIPISPERHPRPLEWAAHYLAREIPQTTTKKDREEYGKLLISAVKRHLETSGSLARLHFVRNLQWDMLDMLVEFDVGLAVEPDTEDTPIAKTEEKS